MEEKDEINRRLQDESSLGADGGPVVESEEVGDDVLDLDVADVEGGDTHLDAFDELDELAAFDDTDTLDSAADTLDDAADTLATPSDDGDEQSSLEAAPEDEGARGGRARSRTERSRARRRKRRNRLIASLGAVGVVAALLGGGALYYFKTTTIVPVADALSVQSADTDPCAKFKHLTCTAKWEPNDKIDRGTLFSQSVKAGKRVSKGSKVELIYSAGPTEVKFPNVVGAPLAEVKDKIYKLGLSLKDVEIVDSEGKPSNVVLAASIKEGETVKNGSEVSLKVSNGRVALPDWSGKTKEFVEVEAKKLGLEASFKEEESEATPGTVVSQWPKAGEVKSSLKVEIVLAKAFQSKDVVVPDVVGKTDTEAQSELASAGFRHIKTVVVKNSEVDTKKVTQVVPGAGQSAKSEENIVIIVSEPSQ